jgi:hypothetical protein
VEPDARVSDRLHLLVDAGIALSSELSLDALLQGGRRDDDRRRGACPLTIRVLGEGWTRSATRR